MPRLPVLLAALLLVAVPAPAFGGVTADAPTLSGDTTAATSPVELGDVDGSATNVLLLDGPQTSGFARADTAVTVTVAASHTDLDGRYSTYDFEARWAAASNDSERLAVVRNATDAAANWTADIASDEATAREAYLDGDISAGALVRQVALDSARADALANYLATVRERTSALSEENASEMRSRIAALRGEIAAYGAGTDGSLRDELAAAVAGDRPPIRVYVAASENGLVLAALDDGTYYHTTYRVDNYDAAPAPNVDLGAFLESLQRLYPTTMNLSASNGGRQSFGAPADAHLYQAVLGYSRTTDVQSTLVVYFDPSTNSVYREDKRLATDDIVTRDAVTRTEDNTTLVVNRTYAGGPLRVAVQNATGAPLTAAVRVNGTPVGTTDPDTGAVWALSPAGAYNVTAERGETTVTINTTAVDPTSD
ncbi:DUF7096 domain-containing protein [Halarchaeum sp. P4]|uniref:DUF7096 domain-containing protein n=1 Tax=Halarchaeum sp. P4 TaxID=3421639 RepID=UPI003EBD5E90